MAQRKWWFEHEMDECMPGGRLSPEACFGVTPSGGITEIDDEGQLADPYDGDGPVFYRVGETVNLCFQDRFPDVELTFLADGTFDAHGPWPRSANMCWVDDDADTTADSLFELAGFMADNQFGEPEEQRGLVGFAFWSDGVPFRIDSVADGKVTLTCLKPEMLERPAEPETPGHQLPLTLIQQDGAA